jgi:Spy/CpxP family protein refolding chaperone
MKQLTGIVAALLLSTGASIGCAGTAANNSPSKVASVSPEEEAATAGLLEHHRHHHHGGVTLLIAMSLDTLGVSPEQKPAVEKIRRDLHAQMEPARAAEQNLVSTLADGLAGGTIDSVKVEVAVTQLVSAAAMIHDASTDALNELHAILTPYQRTALVDKLEAHWSVWQKANIAENDHLAELALDLDLAPDQVDRIRARMSEAMKGAPPFDPQEVGGHIRAFGDAFRAPTFDAKALATWSPAMSQMVGWGAEHMARFIETAGPLLTANQRGNLARMLRQHASHNPSADGD